MGSAPYRDFQVDYDSIISSNMLGWSWVWATNLSVNAAQFLANDVGVERAVIVNLLGGAPNPGRGKHCLIIPPGCTGGVFEIGAMLRTGTNSIRLSVYDDAESVVLATSTVQIDTTRRWFYLPVTLAPGQYWVTIDVNSGAPVSQAQPILYEPAFRPYRTGSGVLSDSFVRVGMTAEIMRGTYYTNGVNGRYLRQCLGAEFECMTDAVGKRYAIESWVQGPGASTNQIVQLVGGQAERMGAVANDLTLVWDEWDIPQRQAVMRVGARNGYQSEWVATSTYQQALRAAYFPASATLQALPPPQSDHRLVAVGDSLMGGALATNYVAQGWLQELKMVFPGTVYGECAGSRSMYTLMKDTATRLQTAERIRLGRPTHILWQLGINDVIVNLGVTWGQTEIEAALGAEFDLVHDLCPNAVQYVVSPFIRASEGTVGPQGTTVIQIRASEQTVATDPSRANYCRYKSGIASDMPTSTYLDVDGIHLKTDGHAIAFTGHRNNIGV